MAPKLGPVAPAPAAVSVPQAGPHAQIGVVAQNVVCLPPEKPPIGVVPPSEVVVSVTPVGVQGPIFGVTENIISAKPPPPPPPDPIGVAKIKEGFPDMFNPVKPRTGVLADLVITPQAVADNIPAAPTAGLPLVEIPNVISPFEGKGEEEKRK